MKKALIDFAIPTKEVLNSNTTYKQMIVKSVAVAKVRSFGQIVAVENHEDPRSIDYVKYNRAMQELSNGKGRLTKKMKSKNATEDEITEAIEAYVAKSNIPDRPEIDYMFNNKVSVTLVVFPPTRRKMDPPNMWATLKPILDAFTDAGWWEDDNSDFIPITNFARGSRLSSKKDHYEFTLVIQEIGETSVEDLLMI